MSRIYTAASGVLLALLLLGGVSLFIHQASAQASQERAQAQVALLGRWGAVMPLPQGESLTLDFHAGTTGHGLCGGSAGRGNFMVSYTLQQVSLRQRVFALLQRHSVPKPVYLFHAMTLPHGCSLSSLGSVWNGTLLGDGNVLVLSAPPAPVVVLHRLGSG